MRPLMKILLFGAMVAAVGSASPLYAAFILDDFDVSAMTVSPEMREDSVNTSNVGVLRASRSIRIAASSAISMPPTAQLDSSVKHPSLLTADLVDIGMEVGGGSPLFAFQFNYIFPLTDVSESGANNAILFDFRSIEGSAGPTFLRVLVTDGTNTRSRFEASVVNLPLRSGAFTGVMPFSSFTVRGGSPGLPDFTTVKQMDFDFFFLFPPKDIQWRAEIDRIRIGRVPEPNSIMLSVMTALCLARRAVESFRGGPKDVVSTICIDARSGRGRNHRPAG